MQLCGIDVQGLEELAFHFKGSTFYSFFWPIAAAHDVRVRFLVRRGSQSGGQVNERSVRVLVVDDFAPWREFVSSIFRAKPEFQIVGQASDGSGGVQKALELQPDLILLDIGLPVLTGVQAATQISEFCPKSKILFLSGDRLPEIAAGLSKLGAHGYVLKANASTELLPAIRAVLSGQLFVSSSLTAGDAGLVDCVRSNTGQAQKTRGGNSEAPNHHEAIFYTDERALLDRVTLFVGSALKAGSAGVVLATGTHRESLVARLQGFGVDNPEIIEQRRYLSFDAEETLATFMLNGVLDQELFTNLFHNLITTARGHCSRIAIFGECVHLLWTDGKTEAAIQMERLGTELTMKYNADILCGYSLAQRKMHSDIYRLICEQHSTVHM